MDQSKQMQLYSARCNRQSRGVVHQFIRYGSLTWLWNFVEVHCLQQETELHLLLGSTSATSVTGLVDRICRADNGGRLNFNAVIAVRRSRYLKPELCTSHDCRVSSRVPSHTCRVSSRVSSHRFFQGPSPESSRESSVSSPSRHESLPKFFESCLESLYSAVGRVIKVTSKVKGISNNLE